MPEITLARHAPMTAGLAASTVGLLTIGLLQAQRRERALRWALLNEAVAMLRRYERARRS